jgi:hypothetical protein
MRRRRDDVLHLCGIPVVKLRDNMVKCSPLIADARERELSFSLSEPQGWPLGPEWWEPHSNSRYLRCLGVIHHIGVTNVGLSVSLCAVLLLGWVQLPGEEGEGLPGVVNPLLQNGTLGCSGCVRDKCKWCGWVRVHQ